MDEITTEMIASSIADLDPDEAASHSRPSSRPGLRAGFKGWREKASIQDRLVIPAANTSDAAMLADDKASASAQRPNFNITTMSNNFRRFNARIGVVFKFQSRVEQVLAWKQYSHTLSLLSVYTFICLDPYLLTILPLVSLILGVLIPAFLARHPAPPQGTMSSEQSVGYTPRGPPLAPAATVKPVKELSKDFFRNMRDLQNVMDDFSTGHDQVVAMVVPLTNFSNEALSSAVFQAPVVGVVLMTIAAHLVPWNIVLLLGGWGAICSGHPSVAKMLMASKGEHLDPHEKRAKTWVDNWIANDVILDSAPESREVEIFELQKSSLAGEWEPWLFSPSPYDPLSQNRISGDRPKGTQFFEDVSPPEGWVWSEKKWALDLWSREWVEERIITGVEVETEGERWVYDIYDENEGKTGVVDASDMSKTTKGLSSHASWEEGDDTNERRGAWRRRRWVRLVKRKPFVPVTSN